MASRFLICTDLDGTLLEERSYSFEAARPALDLMRSRGHLLVFCTSKTFAECQTLQKQMGVRGPLIVENGGCIYIPREPASPQGGVPLGPWRRIPLGVPYPVLRSHLREVGHELSLDLMGMGDAGLEFLKMHCQLTPTQATDALKREFDEPFLAQGVDPSSLERMMRAFQDRGLDVSRGGRFFHLSGRSDKGRAIGVLEELLREDGIECETVGLGDSPNDIPMLKVVRHPRLVMRPDGFHDPEVIQALPGIERIPSVGPVGWNIAIRALLARAEPLPEPGGSSGHSSSLPFIELADPTWQTH